MIKRKKKAEISEAVTSQCTRVENETDTFMHHQRHLKFLQLLLIPNLFLFSNKK